MNNAVNCLINFLGNQGDKEQNNVAGDDIKIPVIYRDFDGVTAVPWKSGNRLDNILKVS